MQEVFLDLRPFLEINSVAPILEKKKKKESVDSVIYLITIFSMM